MVLAVTLLSACGGTNTQQTTPVESDPTPVANLTISQIMANNLSNYEAGDILRVDYQLEVTELEQPDVSIDFYLVHSDSEDETEIAETHFLHTAAHTAVENGSSVDSFAIEIPAVAHSGNYWILAIVDPENTVAEDNESDNHPNIDNEQHVDGDFPAISIEINAPSEHEFEFVRSYVDSGIVILDSPELHEGTGQHYSDIIGHIDAIYHGDHVALAALTAEIEIGGNYHAVTLWDAETGQYLDSQTIEFAYDGDEHFFGFDIGLEDQQLEALYAEYDANAESNAVTIRFTLTDTTEVAVESDNSNNTKELTVPLYFFERQDDEEDTGTTGDKSPGLHSYAGKDFEFTGNKLKIDGSYDKSYGDASKFKVGVELGGEMQVDLLDKAASLEAGGSVDMWIFNAHNTIFGASFDGQAYLTGVNTGYDSEMVIFNTTVYEDSKWVAKFEKTFEKSWEEDRILAKANFSVGPIPMSVKAGIDGSVGFELSIGYALSELYANGDIFSTNFGGYAEGGVDAVVASAGVTIELLIIDNLLAMESSAELGLLEDGEANPRVDYSFELTDDIDVISGRFGLYAEVSSVKWCKKWGIPYPCGTKKKTYNLWFYQTPSVYNKSWTIFSREGTVSL
ncbi:hypothetical protein [Planctobacterium marinum]|uniref:CARDB domain-containing protein n=1 Tax=Planctobacterium marinum TaxID=1631968 RepID=A0AA48KTY7_9ALTE|nr:hypothetical protein MACH26_41930 [Planctobacterium marinum]